MSTIYERIKEVRKSKKMTQQKFAEELGLKQNTIATYEMGKTVPSDRTINDICEKFQINEDWLRNGNGPMKKDASRVEEITDLVSKALNGSNDFKKAVIQAICNRSDKELEVLDTLLREIYDNLPKSETKPAPRLHVIKKAGRDGSFTETVMTDEEVKELMERLDSYPEVPDDL